MRASVAVVSHVIERKIPIPGCLGIGVESLSGSIEMKTIVLRRCEHNYTRHLVVLRNHERMSAALRRTAYDDFLPLNSTIGCDELSPILIGLFGVQITEQMRQATFN